MRNKQVVLLSNGSLLSASLKVLLRNTEGFEFSMVAADDPEMSTKIRQLTPRFIIIDSGDTSLGEGAITRLLEAHPKVKVITLSWNHEGIKVYQMKHVLQTNLDGLLETIRGKGAPVKRRRVQQTEEAITEKNGGDAKHSQVS